MLAQLLSRMHRGIRYYYIFILLYYYIILLYYYITILLFQLLGLLSDCKCTRVASRRLAAASLMAFYGLDLLAWQCPVRLGDPDGDDFPFNVSADEDSMWSPVYLRNHLLRLSSWHVGFQMSKWGQFQGVPLTSFFGFWFAQVRRSRFETVWPALWARDMDNFWGKREFSHFRRSAELCREYVKSVEIIFRSHCSLIWQCPVGTNSAWPNPDKHALRWAMVLVMYSLPSNVLICLMLRRLVLLAVSCHLSKFFRTISNWRLALWQEPQSLAEDLAEAARARWQALEITTM